MTTDLPNFPARLGRLTGLIGLALVISACTGPSAHDSVLPGPSAISSSELLSNPMSLATPSRVVTTFPLLDGSFTLTVRAADGTVATIQGNYTGEAVASMPGNTTATLNVQIAETAKSGSAVTGIRAEGSGAFIGEGDFTLSLTLTSPTTKSSDGSEVKVSVRGTSLITCSATSRILVTQRGSGSTPRLGDVAIDLQHEVGNTGCLIGR
jgi:hypothetical protein